MLPKREFTNDDEAATFYYLHPEPFHVAFKRKKENRSMSHLPVDPAHPHGCPLPLIGPSVLNGDLAKLADEASSLLHDSKADYLHLDVMDGCFVPNMTFGHPVVKCLRDHVGDAFFDVHMMVAKPEQWITPMALAGADQYIFHYEATEEPAEIIKRIKEEGMKAGIAIKPATPVEDIFDFVKDVHTVLIMTVEPGFGGQRFKTDMLDKVRILRQKHKKLNIEVDGGIGPGVTVEECAKAGANMIVSGSAIINSADRAETIREMRAVVQEEVRRNFLELWEARDP